MTVSTLGVQCGVQTRMGFKQLFFFFSPFCNSAQVMVLTTNPLKLKHIALAHIFMTTVGIPQKRWMTNCDCFYEKKDHLPSIVHATDSTGNEEKAAVIAAYVQ